MFYFASDSGTNNNQIFIVSSVSSSSQANTIGFKGMHYAFCFAFNFEINVFIKLGFDSTVSSQDVSFGPYNILMCRKGQISSFPLNAAIIKKGLIVALDFYPYSSTQATQTIFSIRDTNTNVISLRFDYFASSGTLDIWINPVSSTASTTPYYAFRSSGVTSPSVAASKTSNLQYAEFIFN